MVNTLIGAGLFLFGMYNIILANGSASIDTTPLFWAKYLGSVLIGGGVVAYNAYPLVLSKFANFKISKEPMVTNELSSDISIKGDQEQDITALFWLAERVKEDAEGIELCRKLSDKLFSLHHDLKKE